MRQPKFVRNSSKRFAKNCLNQGKVYAIQFFKNIHPNNWSAIYTGGKPKLGKSPFFCAKSESSEKNDLNEGE